jgi:hypothetical protein
MTIKPRRSLYLYTRISTSQAMTTKEWYKIKIYKNKNLLQIYKNNMNENNETPFSTPFERLATVGEKAAVYMRTTEDFAHWVTDNITSIDVEECISIFEDYIKSNEQIIQRINKIKS